MYSAAGETPIATRLASFTQVRGLAFGNYAEVSPDVEDLILQCGHALARKHWRSSGARNEAEARSWWVSHGRMRIGVPPTKFHHASQRSRDEAGERGDRCVNGARAEASEPGLLQFCNTPRTV